MPVLVALSWVIIFGYVASMNDHSASAEFSCGVKGLLKKFAARYSNAIVQASHVYHVRRMNVDGHFSGCCFSFEGGCSARVGNRWFGPRGWVPHVYLQTLGLQQSRLRYRVGNVGDGSPYEGQRARHLVQVNRWLTLR